MSAGIDAAAVAQALPAGFTSGELSLTRIKYSFVAGMGLFLLLVPFCKSRKSFFDAIAARNIVKAFRTLAFAELVCLTVLFHYYLEKGNPIYLHAALSYGNGDSWIYGYGRPSAGVIFVGLGLFGALYSVPRLLCMLGCVVQIVGDALSAHQIYEYHNQVKSHGAPGNGYTEHTLLVYHWRDIVSIALCTTILLLAGWLSVTVGWCDPPLIHPSQVTGKDLDRISVLRAQRNKRKYMERVGIVEAPVLPVFHRHLSDFEDVAEPEPEPEAKPEPEHKGDVVPDLEQPQEAVSTDNEYQDKERQRSQQGEGYVF